VILEWDGIEFQMIPSVNVAGTAPGLDPLPLNAEVMWNSTHLGYFNLDRTKCQAGAARRITRSNLAQADGEITHRKFKSGYVVELNMQLWEQTGDEGIPAHSGVLRKMGDVLGEYLEAMANDDGQLIWFPSTWSGDPTPNPRMLDMCRTMGPSGNDSGGSSFVSVVVEQDPGNGLVDVTFALLSPLPYLTDFMNYPTTPDAVASFSTAHADCGNPDITITNEGNAAYHPVIRVYGPTSGAACDGFQLANCSELDETGSPLTIVWDDTLPGGLPIDVGQYAQIDTFTNVTQLHQAGGGTDNGKPSIDPTQTDYFELVPGANDLSITYYGNHSGSHVEVVYRNAWV
jgi:hypothetical protein